MQTVSEITPEILKKAVIFCVSPTSTPQQRSEAYQICEAFKQSSPQNTELLYEILKVDNDARLRHFAFQVVEHVIKLNWNDITASSRYKIQNVCITLLNQMLPSEPIYVKDTLAKCIVEIVKREWPQQWPSFIDDMSVVCSFAQAQKTDTVMKVFLRLAEDVIIMNTVKPAQRRRDIQSALMQALPSIIPFFITTLDQNISTYHSTSDPTQLAVTKSTLQTIMGYVGWCNASFVLSHNDLLIPLLIQNLTDVNLRMDCVECLLVITQRHGNPTALSPLLSMFSEKSILTFSAVIQQVMAVERDPESHDFMKRLGQTIVGMGELLCILWGKEGKGFQIPTALPQYVQILSVLTNHPSLFVFSPCYPIWFSLLKINTQTQRLGFLSAVTTELCTVSLRRLEKTGMYGDSSTLAGYFATLDYDSMVNWIDHIHRARSSMIIVFQYLWKDNSEHLVSLVVSSIKRLLEETQLQYSGGNFCNKDTCPLYIQWDALSFFTHALSKELTHPSLVDVLQLLLNSTVQELQLQSIMLSVASALFYVIPHSPQAVLDLLLTKIISNVQLSKNSHYASQTYELSRHAAAVFIKLMTIHPSLFTGRFEELHTVILNSKGDLDSRVYRLLTEGLVLVSNEMKNCNTQVQYIRGVIGPTLQKWSNPEVQQSFRSSLEMSRYIGLLSPPDTDPSFQARRHQLQEFLRDFLVVTRRASVPTDTNELARGGFYNESGLVRTPSAIVVLPYMDGILTCLSVTFDLFKEAVIKQFHPSYPPSTTHNIPYGEQVSVLGHKPADFKPDAFNEISSIQRHILDYFDSFTQILNHLSKNSPHEFYRHPNLSPFLSHLIVTHVAEVNTYAFKGIVKSVLRPLCLHCPREYQAVFIAPLLTSALPLIVDRLNKHWLRMREQNPGVIPFSSDSQQMEELPEAEIIEQELLRVASRDLLDMCNCFLLVCSESRPRPVQKDVEVMADIEMMDGTSPSTSENVSLEDKLSDFVLGLPQEEVLYLLWFATISSCWLDSGTVHKAIDLVTPLVRYTHASGWMTPDIADQVTRTLLTCIHTHGKHDTISTKVFSSLLIVYEMLRPTFGNLFQLMLEIPGVTVKRLNRFEAEICLPGAKPSPKVANSNGTYFPCFKKKRELLRSMIVEIIGKDVSEQFKNNVVIRNLPPLIKKRIKKSEDIIAASGGDKESLGLCQMFQPSS